MSEMCSLLNKLALAVKRENLSVIRDEHKKETIFKTVFKLINNSTDDELTAHVLLVLLQVRLYRILRYEKLHSLFIHTYIKKEIYFRCK